MKSREIVEVTKKRAPDSETWQDFSGNEELAPGID
jgi:hypothetical protein